MPKVQFKDWGLLSYSDAWERQQKYFDQALNAKRENKELNYLVFCEHKHVYTLGKSGKEQNLLINNIQLSDKEATFYKVDRGGDITYHGPGQLVVYPIINLANWGYGVREYIQKLEDSITDTLATYDIKGERLEGATGVWLDVGKPNVRKICAMGVRVSRHITMHGLAFNVNTDLKYFDYINPCGFTDKGVTSLEKELGISINLETIKEELLKNIKTHFEMNLIYE